MEASRPQHARLHHQHDRRAAGHGPHRAFGFAQCSDRFAERAGLDEFPSGSPGASCAELVESDEETVTAWARAGKYFATEADLQAFSDDLKHLLVFQKASFNSPVWFNCGIEKKPQCSACFINSVQDTMDSILTLARTEGMLFKFGSGTGSNLSAIRSSKELLAGGGTASGPVSFMKGFDAFAGVIKSGGKTRRGFRLRRQMGHPSVAN